MTDEKGWLTGSIFVPLVEAALNNPLLLILKLFRPAHVAAVRHRHGGRGGALQSNGGLNARFMNGRGAVASRKGASSGGESVADRSVGAMIRFATAPRRGKEMADIARKSSSESDGGTYIGSFCGS
jgi:hypothetical protein